LAPVKGPRLGPFDRRSQALDSERAWLEHYWLPACECDNTNPSGREVPLNG
jgi:hypothetical protein